MWLVPWLSPRMPGSDPRPAHVGFMVHKMAIRQVSILTAADVLHGKTATERRGYAHSAAADKATWSGSMPYSSVCVKLHPRSFRFKLINCYVHTHELLLAFSALECRMRLTAVTHAIAHALSMLNGVENCNACSSARDSDLSGFSCNTAYSIYLLVYE
jgi:hypothetical protein